MKIGFIGTGNMGGAIAKAIAKACPKTTFLLSDPSEERVTALRDALCELEAEGKNPEPQVLTVTNEVVADQADFIYLAVKPQIMPVALESMAETLAARFARGEHFVLVTMAAGIEIERIQTLAEGYYPTIRIMPNTPVLVSEGLVAYTGKNTTESDLRKFARIMKKCGTLLHTEEEKIDSVCAISGCGPAYVYMFLNAFMEEAEALGLTAEEAVSLATQTLRGASEMVRQGKGTPEALRIAVCSPGGATIEGVTVLQNEGLEETVKKAIKAGYDKTLKLK